MPVKISTYRISLTNRVGEAQILNYFNGEDDFFNVVETYCNYIYQNRRDYIDGRGNLRTFSLRNLPNVIVDDRYIYGYFDSAFTGENLDIRERVTNEVLYNVQPQDLQSRNFFFMISIPANSRYAYLVVQRKANHGVKSILENSFSQYLRLLGFLDCKIHIEEAPNYYLLETMLDRGRLKEIKLIKNGLLSSFEEQFNNVGIVNDGSSEKVLKFDRDARSQAFKEVLFRLYRANYAVHEQINIVNEYFDEVSFTMELNDLSKTFYAKDKAKIRSNIDVTNLVMIENGEPSLVSMIEMSLDVIERLHRRNDEPDEEGVA